jgi:hypothetical protein
VSQRQRGVVDNSERPPVSATVERWAKRDADMEFVERERVRRLAGIDKREICNFF